MWGALWIPDQEAADRKKIVRVKSTSQMPTRIAHAIGIRGDGQYINAAVGGMRYIRVSNYTLPTMLEQIKATDLADVSLITLGGGRNDGSQPLGTSESLAGDGTLCGAIREILDYLIANHPKTQIIMTQVTPYASNNSDVFTRAGAGGWTLTDHKAEVSALCAKYGVPYIDWEGCTYMRHWADFSGAGGNWAHPNNEEAYIQMGNYLAGRISSYYSG